MEVFVLQHTHEFDDGTENTKFIGVYSGRAEAEAAIDRLRSQPGFRESPDGFCIDCYYINEDNWREGYFTDSDTPQLGKSPD